MLEGTVTTFCGVNRLTVHTPVAPSGLMTTVSCSTVPVRHRICATVPSRLFKSSISVLATTMVQYNTHMRTHAHARANTHTHTHARTHTRTNTRAHTHTHARARTHAHQFTPILNICCCNFTHCSFCPLALFSINKRLHIWTPLKDTINHLCPSYRWFSK